MSRYLAWTPGGPAPRTRPGPVRGQRRVEDEERAVAAGPRAHLREEEVAGVALAVVVVRARPAVDGEATARVVVDPVDRHCEVAPVGLGEVVFAGRLVQVLADPGRPVALVAQPLRQEVLDVVVRGEDRVAPERLRVVADRQVVVRQLAGEQRRPGRAAQRVGADRPGERHARVPEPAYGGQEAQLVGPHVVGEHHDDVRPVTHRRRRRRTGLRRVRGEGRDRRAEQDRQRARHQDAEPRDHEPLFPRCRRSRTSVRCTSAYAGSVEPRVFVGKGRRPVRRPHQPRWRHSSTWGRSTPRVESLPWPG